MSGGKNELLSQPSYRCEVVVISESIAYIGPSIAAVASLTVCVVTFYFNRVLWKDTHRPVVMAEVVVVDAGNMGTLFNLVLTNYGNRPATRVRLIANRADLISALSTTANTRSSFDEQMPVILRCFSDTAVVPVLGNNKSVANSFGSSGKEKNDFWKMGAEFPIFVEYSDVHGRQYKDAIKLKVFSPEMFAGGVWRK